MVRCCVANSNEQPIPGGDRPRCVRCGVPVRRGATYCCLGCALRYKVPVDEKGQYPVNGALITALAVGFVYFNELLLWGASALVRADGRADLGDKLAWASAGVAVATWGAVVGTQAVQRAFAGRDAVVGALVLAILASAFRISPPALAQMASANAVLLLWSCRGLLRNRAGE